MYLCMCICVYIYIYVYTHINNYTSLSLSLSLSLYIYIYIHTHNSQAYHAGGADGLLPGASDHLSGPREKQQITITINESINDNK